jgi:hypothetical protein
LGRFRFFATIGHRQPSANIDSHGPESDEGSSLIPILIRLKIARDDALNCYAWTIFLSLLGGFAPAG